MYDTMTNLSRVQVRGQVTIPSDLRKKYGLQEGDFVSFVPTEKGILITPQEVVAMDALDKIGEILQANGISLDEVIKKGREIRGDLLKEKYDFEDNL